MSKFWKFTNSVDSSESELTIEGVISQESWWGDEVTPQEFKNELAQHKGSKLTVVINSGGGDVFAGMSIYNALREHEAEITVRVDGLAASAASIIAMAGSDIVMSPGSVMMIHRASVLAAGNAEDLEKAKNLLLTIEESIIPIYADRTGLAKEEIERMMDEETWMSAEKAVELGFADRVAETVKKADAGTEVQDVFNGKFAFSMSATKEAIKNFVTKVAESEEKTDPKEEVKNDVKVEPETIKEEEIEVKEEKEKMSAKDIATDQVVDQKPKVEPKANMDYLKTKASMQDFANVLAANAGKDAEAVRDAWKEHASVKMNITNPEILLPEGVIQAIRDAFEEGGEIWSLVNKTNLDVFKVAWDTVTGEDSRAKGHTRGDEKAEEVITLDDRTLRAQFIYKYLTLDKETVRENRSTGALLRYVLSELPRRIVREIERAIVIGDGRDPSSDYKITSFVSIKADAADENAFASTYTPDVGESSYESLLRALELVKAEGTRYLVTKKSFVTNMLLLQGVNGGYIFQPGTNLGNVFNLGGIITPDWMDEDTDNDAYIFVPREYRTVGDTSIESFSNFILKENKNEYLQEIYTGGGLTALDAAVAIAALGS